jgi:hypothetical protein
MLAESLLSGPAVLSVYLRPTQNALLPLPFREAHNFGTMLEPRWIVGTERLDQ